MEWIERKETIEVPRATGVEGFILVLREILMLSRVQGIQIDSKGKIDFTRFVANDDSAPIPLEVDLTTVSPHSLIRNAETVEEVTIPPNVSAALAVAMLFKMVSDARLVPLAFATGVQTTFLEWHRATTGIDLGRNVAEVYGLPLHRDRHLPDSALFICAGYNRGSLINMHASYKIGMPER